MALFFFFSFLILRNVALNSCNHLSLLTSAFVFIDRLLRVEMSALLRIPVLSSFINNSKWYLPFTLVLVPLKVFQVFCLFCFV